MCVSESRVFEPALRTNTLKVRDGTVIARAAADVNALSHASGLLISIECIAKWLPVLWTRLATWLICQGGPVATLASIVGGLVQLYQRREDVSLIESE